MPEAVRWGALADNVALKLDYQHAEFGSLTLEGSAMSTAPPGDLEVNIQGIDVITAGLVLGF